MISIAVDPRFESIRNDKQSVVWQANPQPHPPPPPPGATADIGQESVGKKMIVPVYQRSVATGVSVLRM